MTEAMAPAGWYADGLHPNVLRWWDGSRWTEHTQPLAEQHPSNSVADNGTFTATYTLTSGDLWRATLHIFGQTPFKTASRFLLLPVVVGLFVAFPLGYGVAGTLLLIAIYLVVFAATIFTGFSIRYRTGSEALRLRTITASHQGVVLAVGHQRTWYEWPAFSDASSCSAGLVLRIGKTKRFLLVPNRAFSSPTEEGRMNTYIQQHVFSRYPERP